MGKGKIETMILKLDAFAKPLPGSVPKDDKFRSYSGVFLTLLMVGGLGGIAYLMA